MHSIYLAIIHLICFWIREVCQKVSLCFVSENNCYQFLFSRLQLRNYCMGNWNILYKFWRFFLLFSCYLNYLYISITTRSLELSQDVDLAVLWKHLQRRHHQRLCFQLKFFSRIRVYKIYPRSYALWHNHYI